MYDGYRMACALDHGSLIGTNKTVGSGFGEGAFEQAEAEALRRLGQDNEFPWNRGRDQRPVRGPLHLLDGIDGGQSHDGCSVFNHGVDSAIDGGGVDQGPHRVVDEYDVVWLGRQRGERMGHRLLPVVAAFYDLHSVSEPVLTHLGLDSFHLRLAYRNVNRTDPSHLGKGAQRVNQDGNSIEREELFRLRAGHPCSETCRGENHKHLHTGWSIQHGVWRTMAYSTERYDPLVPVPLPTLAIDTTLLKPGLRVAVGLSGGADSVALLRILAERSRELGLVLHAAHLHHGLRGAEADADRDFCRELARRLGLMFHEARVNTAAAAMADGGAAKAAETIEEAARRLRYGWFRELMASGVVDAVATAHTRDDQAETVLARFLRGAWTEGLSGIYPVVQFSEGRILRPMLATTRSEIEAYLGGIGQSWREDSSNRHLTFTRNRIRHELLPLLEGWNPRLRAHLAQMAELARNEEAWWAAELERLAPQIVLPGRPVRGGGRAAGEGLAVEVARLAELPPALQRRILRLAAGRLGSSPDFESTESLRKLALAGRAGQKCELAQGLRAERTHRELQLTVGSRADSTEARIPTLTFQVPGEIVAPMWGIRVRVVLGEETARTAVLRDWKPGDRVRLRHSGGPRKVKEVLERLQVFGSARTHWPVLELDRRVIWMQGVELEPEPGIEIRVSVLDLGSEAAEG